MSQEMKVIVGNEKFVEAKNSIKEQELVASIQMQLDFAQKVLLTAAYSIGKMLTESKEFIKHGEWENWVRERLPFKLRAAQNYMKVYNEYKGNDIDNSSAYSSLGYSQALALLAVPSDEREEFAKEVNAKDLTIKELEETIKAMQSRQSSKDKELEELKTANKKLEGEHKALTNDFDKLTERIGRLQQEKKEAEDKQDAELAERLEASIQEERKKIETLEKDKKSLDEKIKLLGQKQIEAIAKVKEDEQKKREQEINKKNRELESATRKFTAKIEELKEKNSMQKAMIKEAEDTAKLSRELVKAEVLLSNIESDYESLTIILKKLQRTYPDHVTELKAAISDILEKMEKKGKLQIAS